MSDGSSQHRKLRALGGCVVTHSKRHGPEPSKSAARACRIHIRAPAKLNLFLEVLRKRPDGYHELVTVMQRISLYDLLTFEPAASGIEISCSDPTVPTDERNLVWRAVDALRLRSGGTWGCRVVIEKHIPAGAGLGGGSSNGAAALKAANALYELGHDEATLREIAASLGSDVPFFLGSPTAVCRGRGEILEALEAREPFHYVLLLPRVHVSTAEVYGHLELTLTPDAKDVSVVAKGIISGDPEQVGASLFNRLEGPAFALNPSLADWVRELASFDVCGAMMSGSGSAVFALCRDSHQASHIQTVLSRKGCGDVLHVTSDLS